MFIAHHSLISCRYHLSEILMEVCWPLSVNLSVTMYQVLHSSQRNKKRPKFPLNPKCKHAQGRQNITQTPQEVLPNPYEFVRISCDDMVCSAVEGAEVMLLITLDWIAALLPLPGETTRTTAWLGHFIPIILLLFLQGHLSPGNINNTNNSHLITMVSRCRKSIQ